MPGGKEKTMEDEMMFEVNAEPSEEMTAEQEADFEAGLREGDAQAADATKKEKAPEKDADISAEMIEEAANDQKKQARADAPKSGVTVTIDGQAYTFSQEELEKHTPAPSPERQMLEQIASQAGIGFDELMRQMEGSLDEAKSGLRAEQLMEQGYEPGMARHIAQIELENAKFKNGKAGSREEARIFEGIAEFEAMYPEVEDLPPSVVREIRAGATPVAAYQKYLLDERERELQALRQEKKNREKSPGSIRGMSVEAEDPFIVELMK